MYIHCSFFEIISIKWLVLRTSCKCLFPLSLKDIVLLIADKLGKNSLVKLGALPQKENEPAVLFGDTKRLFSEVVWQPQYDLDGGIRETIDWWQERCGNEAKSE